MSAQQVLLDLLSPSPLVAGLVVLGVLGVGVVAAASSSSMLKGRHSVFGVADGGNEKNESAETLLRGRISNGGAVNDKASGDGEKAAHPEIEPVPPGFSWQDTAPLQLRPYKPTYFITMALRSSTPSDLIVIDSNYTDRIWERKRVIESHPEHVLGCIPGPPTSSSPEAEKQKHETLFNGSPGGVEAVRELYAYLLGEYLPARYPTLFSVSLSPSPLPSPAPAPEDRGSEGSSSARTFHNKITGASFPAELPRLGPDDTDAAMAALRILGETVEDDLLLLQQDPSTGGQHRLVAMVCCNPSGFDPAEKLGHVLRDIHAPVPSYGKIERSMERFFSRLEAGKSSSRVNWSITTNAVQFNLASNHIKEGQEAVVDDEAEEIDPAKAFLRCELQTTTRLAGSTGAILFSIKTFMYPLAQLREDVDEQGRRRLGPELADAIEGLRDGNAPGMWTYKGAVRWGGVVCEYLRS